ncbi:MAG: hypothetical protein ACK528_15485, partial [Alphaproteobacteria bacterium]
HSPLAATDLIRREAERMHVTPVTIRNLLRRAEQRGMIRRDGRMLSLSEQGVRRVRVGMDAFETMAARIVAPEAMPDRTAQCAIPRGQAVCAAGVALSFPAASRARPRQRHVS